MTQFQVDLNSNSGWGRFVKFDEQLEQTPSCVVQSPQMCFPFPHSKSVTCICVQVCWASADTRLAKGSIIALKLKAEFPVKCRDSAVLNELNSGGVTFDASNCTSHAFVSNGTQTE